MLIDGKKIAFVTVKDKDGKIVARLTDEQAQTAKGYTVQAMLDNRPGPDAIAYQGDVLYYIDSPEKKYIVTRADDKFFTMTPTTVNEEKEELEYDNLHERVYPNNKKIGILADYGIQLEYRGMDDDNEEENSPAHD